MQATRLQGPGLAPPAPCRRCRQQQLLRPLRAAPLPWRVRAPPAAAAKRGGSKGGGDDVIGSILKFADKAATDLGLGLPGAGPRRGGAGAAAGAALPPVPFGAVHALLISLAAAWALTGPLGLLAPAALALDRARPWTALADAWVAPGAELLARNLFFGYMFGRAVDNAEGGQGLWLTFVLAAAGGSLAAMALLPRRAPIIGSGANGALFGLFAMATLFSSRRSWHWHRWFELAALLPFVATQLLASQPGLAQWSILQGARLPGGWAPLLGGLAGAAAAAALLYLGRIVAAGIQQQRQQAAAAAAQQQQQGGEGGGGGGGGAVPPGQAPEPVSALLGRAATLLLKRLM